MENMDQKYAELISKNGPLFMNLKYMERLNLEDSSLVKEKWTTELFERLVEVMPIIFENEENDQKDEKVSQFVDGNFTGIYPQADTMAFPYEEEVDVDVQNVREAPGGKAWWITLNEDIQVDRFKQKNPLFLRPTIEGSKPYIENEPKSNPAAKGEMKILFERAADAPYGLEKNEKIPMENPQSVKKHVKIASYPQQDVGTSFNPVAAPDDLDPLSSANKNDKSKFKFPISDINEKNIHGITSGRIARSLSGKYSTQVTEDNLLKRTTSVMDLPLRTDKSDLSSLYDELYAEMMEKKANPFLATLKAKRPVLELFRNPNYEQNPVERVSKNDAPPNDSKLKTDDNSSILEKKDEKISRKRTHQNM